MSLLLALLSGAPPAADLLCPSMDDGRRRQRGADLGWCPGFLSVAAVADLFAPAAQETPKRKRRADAWQAFLAPDADLFAPVLDDGTARLRAPGDWMAAGLDAPAAPAVDLFAGMLDDGAGAVRRWADECATGALPQDALAAADLFGAVLDDGFVRRRPADTLHAYMPPDVEVPAPAPAPVTAASGGSHARKATRAYDRSQQIKRQNEAILAVIISAVTSGALE
jgi:hypothetical protein